MKSGNDGPDMTPKKPKSPAHSSAADTSKAVDDFMATLEHPHKAEIQAIRSTILDADPSIREGIKWNAPSFRTTEYFATTHLREKKGVGIILHLGARVRELAPGGIDIADPQQLLQWLARDRAMVVFKDMDDFTARRAAFAELIRGWIAHV